MKHPTRETWLAYLYREGDGQTKRRSLQRHLSECAECRTQLASWESVRQELDSWSLPPDVKLPFPSRFWAPLAAAAAIVLALGAVLGRYSAPASQDVGTLREAIRLELRELASETQDSSRRADPDKIQALLTEYALMQEERRREDLATLARALNNLKNQHASDYASLRRDLETVAVITDASLRQTQNRMVQLASFPTEDPRPNTH